MSLGYTMAPLKEDWAALTTDRVAGVCIRCRFSYEADDCYITFGADRGYCQRCHDYIIGDDPRIPMQLAREINVAEPAEWVTKPQGKDPRLDDFPYEVA